MGGTRRDTGFGLDEVNDIEPKAAREIGPGIVIGNELYARERRQSIVPSLTPQLELGEEAFAMGDDALSLLRCQTHERFSYARGDDDGVLRVQPVMRVGHPVRVTSFVHNALSANCEQRNTD